VLLPVKLMAMLIFSAMASARSLLLCDPAGRLFNAFVKGFGLPLSYRPDIESWTLWAYNTASDSAKKEKIKVIAYRDFATGEKDLSYWYLTSNGDLALNTFFKATSGQKLLYNPQSKTTDQNAYFTDAEVEITFKDTPSINMDNSPYVVMTIGVLNDFNVRGVVTATPEPGTLLLLGIGLIGIGLIMREML